MKWKDAYSCIWGKNIFKMLTHVYLTRFKDIPKHQTLQLY